MAGRVSTEAFTLVLLAYWMYVIGHLSTSGHVILGPPLNKINVYQYM